MKGNEQLLYQYMVGSSKRFIIPVYQRNYDWKIEHCKKLFDDLINLSKNNLKKHFFGSIVSSSTDKQDEYLIIDGQQRLTTVSLLLLAMYNLLEENILKIEDETLKIQLFDEYLVDRYKPKETRVKLKSVKNDAKAFNILVNKNDDPMESSNITINYQYFYNRIQEEEISISDLYESFKKLEIINIFLGPEDNPQLIFESLNSTGLDLNEGDKIRNYILMNINSPELQEEYYEKYWHPIEKATNYNSSEFIRDYLTIKLTKTSNKNKVYYEFKKYFSNCSLDKEGLLIDLLEYAKRYEQLIKAKSSIKEIEPPISRLSFFEATVTRPFLMQILKLSESENGKEPILNEHEVVEILNIIESYLLRRQICDIPTSALNKIFATLHREIGQIDKTTNNYLEKFKYILLKKQGSGVFPNDTQFTQGLTSKDIYSMNSKKKQYIMERFENWGTKETKNVYDLIKNETYSIEHIMPQTLTHEWKESLGSDWKNIHETWLHRLANITLTAYNSNYQNSSFLKKREMENGFKDSGIRMNQKLTSYDKWTEKELEDRNKEMIKNALKIWPMIRTNFKDTKNSRVDISLADDYSLTGKTIVGYDFLGAYTRVKDWTHMYISIIKYIVELDPQILISQVNKKENEIKYYFDNCKISDRYEKIYDGIYVNKHNNTSTKMIGLRHIFKLYDIDENELIFVLKSDEDVKKE